MTRGPTKTFRETVNIRRNVRFTTQLGLREESSSLSSVGKTRSQDSWRRSQTFLVRTTRWTRYAATEKDRGSLTLQRNVIISRADKRYLASAANEIGELGEKTIIRTTLNPENERETWPTLFQRSQFSMILV